MLVQRSVYPVVFRFRRAELESCCRMSSMRAALSNLNDKVIELLIVYYKFPRR